MNRSQNFLLPGLIIISIMASASATTLLSVSPASALPGGLVPRGPILIDGNADFTPANGVTSGSGTADDLYIIEGWDISADNANGIEIRNTTAHFVIRNNYVHDGRSENKHGIYLVNVKNGKIENVTSSNNFHGIYLVYFSGGNINNCISENNLGKGIWLWFSPNNNLTNCTARNNNFEDIHIWYSDNNKVSNSVLERSDHGITIDHSNNNTVTNGIAGSNGYGIIIYFSNNNTIENFTVKNNNFGISIVSSNNNTIMNSTIENNNLGSRLQDSSDNNRIYHNNFVNNVNQAQDEHSNFWDDGYPSGGNYWSDYTGADADNDGIGDTPYLIPGGTNLDWYPFMNPIVKASIGPPPGPPGQPWDMIIGITVAATVIIGIVAWRLLNLRKRGQ